MLVLPDLNLSAQVRLMGRTHLVISTLLPWRFLGGASFAAFTREWLWL